MSRQTPEMMIIAGNSHRDLAVRICERLNIRPADCSMYYSTNRETVTEIGESVRGRDVYIVQTGGKDVNNCIMELLIMAYACKTSSAGNIVGVIPYLPYARQSKMRKRGCIVSKLLAKMIAKAGFSQIITVDMHKKEVQGFFDIPVDNLRASPFLLQYIQESIADYRNSVIVAKDPGSVKRATSFAERLRIGFAVIHGEDKDPDEQNDGRSSPPPSFSTAGSSDFPIETIPHATEKNKPPLSVVGEVAGRIAIIVADIIDDPESFVAAAECLLEKGASNIYVIATHGLLSRDAPNIIDKSPIREVVVTNTVPYAHQCNKIKVVDISILISEAIRRIHNHESMSYLFRNVSTDD